MLPQLKPWGDSTLGDGEEKLDHTGVCSHLIIGGLSHNCKGTKTPRRRREGRVLVVVVVVIVGVLMRESPVQ